jgi:hypothetical protein
MNRYFCIVFIVIGTLMLTADRQDTPVPAHAFVLIK